MTRSQRIMASYSFDPDTSLPLPVIPGSPGGRGPEPMNTGLWKMDSGLTAARAPRPGMTIWGRASLANYVMTDPRELARGCRDKAARCRRLARQTTDRQIAERLVELA